ncbi:MAG: cardiolipin synthase [Dorea sp.]
MLENLGQFIVEIHNLLWENLFILNILLSLLIIFFQRREPSTVWAWLLLLYFVPVLGFILYLMMGQNFRKEKMFKMKEIEGEVKYAVRRQEESIFRKKLRLRDPELERFKSLILYNLNEAEAVLTDNNDIRIYTSGEDKFNALLNEMEHARNYIHLEYYIIRNDELWEEIEKVLIRKARQGVEVRVLFDSMGCRTMHNSDWKRLENAGIEVAEFFPAIFGKLQLRVNYRNHRKIVVIDGRIGFVGGFNIGREYLGRNKKFGNWRDTHICIEGSAVTSLAVRFVLDWNYAAKENLFLEDRLFEIPEYVRMGRDPVQIVSSGPDSHSQEIRNNYLKMIHMAKKNVYIQTPYFVPDDAILNALKIAAKSGVDVRIMVPCKPDHPFVYWATTSYLGEMIEAGARCYTYDDGFLHTKCMCVDGLVSCMGTANMDIRSFKLNFEVNAVIYSAKTTRKLEEAFENDISKSTFVTKKIYEKRSMFIRFKEQFCRLFSPVL